TAKCPAPPMHAYLDKLFADLDAAPDLSATRLRDWIQRCPLRLADVEPYCRFNPARYVRNLLYEGHGYHALVLCWRSGQRSPIHDHRGSGCAVKVLAGQAIETSFRRAPNGMVVPTGSRTLLEGESCYSEDADMHQVSNLQAGNADLVTLHVYAPPLLNMSIYDIDGSEPREYHDPVLTDLTAGAGI
ncbi:MAG: cysteine dioxygenase family protein, partial [Planctomycetota bacterium]